MCNEKRLEIENFLMELGLLDRITPALLEKRIRAFNEKNSTHLSKDELVNEGYIARCLQDERYKGAAGFMDDGYYVFTQKAKEAIRQ